MPSKFYVNPVRFNYLLEQYRLSLEDFIEIMNKGRKQDLYDLKRLNRILKKEEEVSKAFLKRVDKIFEKGLTWIISKRDLPSKKNSIFFRKDTFNSELNFESKKKISSYEELKFETELLSKQIGFRPKRRYDYYTTWDDALKSGKNIREEFDRTHKELISKGYIKKPNSDRDFLHNLIRIIEHKQIFVFEFVDRKRLPERMINFDGLFMIPNIIVLKRQQKYLRREIFTLLHEFAHYLLSIEEVDDFERDNPNYVERWCNDFAYAFLINEYEKSFSSLPKASKENNFHEKEISRIQNNTYLSAYALYTRLRIEDKISKEDYDMIKENINEAILRTQQEKKIRLERKLAGEQGKDFFISTPKEIPSKLFEEIVKINYFKGNVDENRLRQYLNVKDDKSIEEVIY